MNVAGVTNGGTRGGRGGRRRLTRAVGCALLLAGTALVAPVVVPNAFAKGLYTPNTAGPPTADGIQPTYHSGNITSCPVGTTTIINTSDTGPGNQSVSYSNGSSYFNAIVYNNGDTLKFTTNLTNYVVYVKGGPAYDTYDYTGTAFTADDLLHMPVNNGGNISTISHYLVCGSTVVQPPPTFPTVLVGYADAEHGGTVHDPGAPWPPSQGTSASLAFAGCPAGSATTDFVTCVSGNSNPVPTDFDSGAIDLRNATGTAMSLQSVTVTVNGGTASQCTFDIWPHNSMSVPANGDLVLAQTGVSTAPCGDGPQNYNFDTSDTQISPCVTNTVAPTITVTLGGGASHTFTDSSLVLTGGGNDPGSCVTGGSSDETTAWTSTS